MKPANFAYSVIQAIHNLGGALTLGLALLFIALALNQDMTRRMLWALLAAWGVQGATGISFAASSYFFYGAFPDINLLAQTAMGIKVACVAVSFSMCAWMLYKKQYAVSLGVKKMLLTMPIIAQVSAAILRWSS